MRNLSSFVGENFVDSICKISDGLLIKNPHQDSYPDLLVMTDEGKKLLKTFEKKLRDKSPFSNFETGGKPASCPVSTSFDRPGLPALLLYFFCLDRKSVVSG